MVRALLISLFLTQAAYAQRTPKLTVSPLQVASGEGFVAVRGVGFTPNRNVISHLRRPDRTEYGVLQFLTNDQGEFSHRIETLLLATGTHELWAVDESSNAVSDTVRFTVGFEATPPAPPEVQQALAHFIGVWRGSGARNSPSVPSTILLAITGGNTGPAAGTIAYPSLSCGGVLTFRAISIDSIQVYETVTYGADRCMGNGSATMKLAQDGSLLLEGTATGKLQN